MHELSNGRYGMGAGGTRDRNQSHAAAPEARAARSRVSAVVRICAALLASTVCGLAQAPGKGLVIVLIGPPGSGKTTQADFLQKKYEIPVLAADGMRTKAAGSADKLNALVRDEVLREDAKHGFVIDGYPATRSEADYLGKVVQEAKLPPPIIIQIDIPDAEVRRRMQGREDRAQLEKRLATYHKELDLARSYYPQSDIWTIIGTRTPKQVFETIVTLVEDRANQNR